MDYAPVGLAILLVAVSVVAAIFLSKPSKAKFLNKQRQKLTLGERKQLSHDTVLFRFTLPRRTPVLGLPVGKHFKVFGPNPKPSVPGEWNGREDAEVARTGRTRRRAIQQYAHQR